TSGTSGGTATASDGTTGCAGFGCAGNGGSASANGGNGGSGRNGGDGGSSPYGDGGDGGPGGNGGNGGNHGPAKAGHGPHVEVALPARVTVLAGDHLMLLAPCGADSFTLQAVSAIEVEGQLIVTHAPGCPAPEGHARDGVSLTLAAPFILIGPQAVVAAGDGE